jgi:hypothetical protein
MPPGGERAPTISWKRLGKALSTVGVVLAATSAIASTALKVAGVHNLPQYLALGVLFSSPLYLGRLVVEGFAGYLKLRSQDEHERRLTRLYLASIVLLGLWVAVGLVFWRWHSAFWEIVAIAVLLGLATWNACRIVDVLPKTDCERGTEWLREQDWFIKLRETITKAGLLRKVERSLDNITDPHETSSFFDRLSLVLVIIFVALVPSAGAEAVHELKPPETASSRNTAATATTTTSTRSTSTTPTNTNTRPTTTTTTPRTTTTTTTFPPQSEPSYAEQCPNSLSHLTGGSDSDETIAVAESLLALWELEGATEAGCPGRARQVRGHPRIWYAAGSCGTTPRSLGVYVPGQGSTMQYQQAAAFGLELAKGGRLLNASGRGEFDGGDVYVFETPQGTYSLSRPQAGAGEISEKPPNLWCERFKSNNTAYVRTDSNATRAWREVDQKGRFTWPVLRSNEKGDALYDFMSAEEPSVRVARAVCIQEQPCTTWLGEEPLPAAMTAPVTIGELRDLANGADEG